MRASTDYNLVKDGSPFIPTARTTENATAAVDWTKAIRFDPCRNPGTMCVLVSPPPRALIKRFHLPFFAAEKVPSDPDSCNGGTANLLHDHVHIFTMEHLREPELLNYLKCWEELLLEGEEAGREAFRVCTQAEQAYATVRQVSEVPPKKTWPGGIATMPSTVRVDEVPVRVEKVPSTEASSA